MAVTLDVDIWYLVFQQMSRAEMENTSLDTTQAIAYRRWVRSLRLVSKDFDTIITPYAYHTIAVSKEAVFQQLAWSPPQRHTQFRKNICHFTRALTVCCTGDGWRPKFALELLLDCQVLESFRWLFCHSRSFDHIHFETTDWVTGFLYAFLSNQKSSTRINFEEIGGGISITHNRLPTKLTRQLQLRDGTPEKETALAMHKIRYSDDSTKKVASKHRKTVLAALCLSNMNYSEWHGHRQTWSDRFPPMEKLKLYHWKWTHSKQDSRILWNFSRLRSLSLFMSDFARFVRNVPVKHLTKLRAFKIKHYPAHRHHYDICHKFLVSLLKECKKLESFKIEHEQWQDLLLDINDLAGAGGRLRKLRLTSGQRYLLALRDLKGLLGYCHNIQALYLDMPRLDINYEDTKDFISALVKVESLIDLTLRTECGELEGAETNSIDPAYDNAVVVMKALHAQKAGQTFNKVTIKYTCSHSVPYPNDCTKDDIEYCTRSFVSRIDNSGVYEQWGNDRLLVRLDNHSYDEHDSDEIHINEVEGVEDDDLTETSSVDYGSDEAMPDLSEDSDDEEENSFDD